MSESASTPITAAAGGGKKDASLIALAIGLIGVAIAGYGMYEALQAGEGRNLQSWLLGFTFWLAIGTGMLFITMIWYVFDANWPIVVRRQLEHAFAAFPVLALAFLPLLLINLFYQDNPGILWKWMNPELTYPGGHEIGHDPLWLHKSGYLNPQFFTGGTIVFFAIFCGLGLFLRKCSFQQDKTGDVKWASYARKMSAAGIPLYALAVTLLAAIPFLMSLSYHWFSTMYGVWFFATSMRAGIAVTILLCWYLSEKGYLKGLYNQAHRYDLACIALTFTIFWAYVTFSQYFLIYNANIPEETFWFNIRELGHDGEKNSWWYVGLGLVFGYFLIPFLVLLWYKTKIVKWRLNAICIWILLFHLLDLYFNIMPTKKPYADAVLGYKVTEFMPNPYDLASIIGIGGLCAWAWIRSSKKAECIPVRDPRIVESIHHHE